MVAHKADGFGLEFTSRTSWKARRYRNGQEVDVVPITWTKGLRFDESAKATYLEVWYRNRIELENQQKSTEPFVVAVAFGNYDVMPHRFKEFRGVFEVRATGRRLSERSIETMVLRRLNAERDDD